MYQQVFQLGEPREVDLQLRVAPAGVLAHLAAAKAVVSSPDLSSRALLLDHVHHQREQPACLRRQLIERVAEHFMRQLVGERDVLQCRLQVAEGLAFVFRGTQHPLMLVQQCDHIDEG